jgi:ribosome maturation factor RimP
VLASLGLELFDLYLSGSGRGRTLRVIVERAGEERGVDLDTIALASQAITPLLDDDVALAGPFVLEVTSPGVERTLRRPEHFARAVGETVSVKYRTDTAPQRLRGTITAAGDDAIELDVDGEHRHIVLADVVEARTVFEWGPSPRPGKRGGAPKPARKKETSRR